MDRGYPEDFALIRRIIESLYPRNPEFRLEDVLELFDRDRGLFPINAHVGQKKPENYDFVLLEGPTSHG